MKTLIIINKNIAYCLTLLMLSSCAIPSGYNFKDIEGANMTCLSPKQDMLIYMPYNICPLLSEFPTPRERYWKIENLGGRFSKENIGEYSNVNTHKICNKKSKTMHFFPLNKSDKIYISEISTRNDTVRVNRLFLYGKTNKKGQELDIYGEVNGNNLKSIKKRIFGTYKLCKRGR